MGVAVGEILPMALGVAISPIPIVAVILMLFSPKAKILGPVFVLGWILGLAIVSGIILFLADPTGMQTDSGGPSTTVSIIHLVLGALLLLLALRNWRHRPKAGETPKMPKWMQAIDSVTPVKGLGIAVFLSGINPKNLLLTIAAATAIAQENLPTDEEVGVLAVFIVLSSLTVAVPVVWYLVSTKRAEKTLGHWRTWLVGHNAIVMAVLLLVFGVNLIGKGISGLSA